MSKINQIQVGNTTYDIGVSLENVSGVTVSNPSAGQVLKYDGSGWVNGEASTGSSNVVTSADNEVVFTLANNTLYQCINTDIISLTISGVATGFEYASLMFTARAAGTTFGMPENGETPSTIYYCVGAGCSEGAFSPEAGMRYNLAIQQEPDRIAIYVAEAL